MVFGFWGWIRVFNGLDLGWYLSMVEPELDKDRRSETVKCYGSNPVDKRLNTIVGCR